jgi:hypothetical protein
MVEDLERIRIAATDPFDTSLVYEIKKVKEELAKQGYVHIDGCERPFRLVPEK